MEFLKSLIIRLFIIIILLTGSCITSQVTLIQNQDEFPAQSIKIDGFYYYKWKDGGYSIKFIYGNGTILSLGGTPDENQSIREIADKIISRWEESNYQENKYLWGAIFLEEAKLQIKRWQAAGLSPDYVKTVSGIILSDSSFVIESIKGKRLDEPRIYHFHPYSPKPDSTNSFIEDLE